MQRDDHPPAVDESDPERVEYHALELGSGRTVVFVHDIFGSHEDFAGVMEVMAEDWRTVGIDLPGHGKSTPLNLSVDGPDVSGVAEELRSVLAEFGALPAAFVGEGAGATLAVEIAAAHPGDVTALVLVSPSLGAELELLEDPAVVAWLESGDRRGFVDAVLPARHCGQFFLDQPGRAGLERERLGELDAEAVEPIAEVLREGGDRLERVGDLGMRVMVVSGDEDGATGRRRARSVAEVAGVPLKVVPGCGPAVSVERPDELAGLIGRFLDAR